MSKLSYPMKRWPMCLAVGAALAGVLLLAACEKQETPAATTAPAVSPTATAKAAPPAATSAPAATTAPAATAAPTATKAPAPANTPVPLKALKVEPPEGYVGAKFTIAAEGLPAGKDVEFMWDGWVAKHVTEVIPDNVQYIERLYSKKRVTLGRTGTDAQGRASISFNSPEDHGEVHDIFAVVDGKDVAKGGYRLMRSVEISSVKGALGSPITITVKGMATSYYQSTMSVQWDNHYTGYISTVTTKGTGVAQIRAAGPVGDHVIQVVSASQGMPYLNSYDNGRNWHMFSHLPEKFVFTTTEDKGAPDLVIEWPLESRVGKLPPGAPRTTGSVAQSPLAVSTLLPISGPVLSKATLRSEGLPPNADVEMLFVTARGNRTSGSGWILDTVPLGTAKTGANGSLQTTFEIPDDLGGWHTVRMMVGGKLVSEAPYYVERSVVSAPKKVKAGEMIEIRLKGVGWTELDNGVAVTYDNAYFGYACGFSSNGTVNLRIPAVGGKGTHLIDLWPMLYEGHANKQVFNFQVPQLTGLQDHPGLELGYRFPIFRLAVEVE